MYLYGMKGTVYLLLTESPDGIEQHKIGITTKEVEDRVKQLSTGNPNKISILRSFKTRNYKKVEKALHRRFRCLSEAENEWRALSDSDVFSFLDVCAEIDSNIEYLMEYNSLFK